MARRRLFQFPLAGVTDANWTDFVTSHFGENRGNLGSFHTGTDLAAPAGTPIYPIYDGTIDGWGYNSTYGNWVRVKHDEAAYSYYYHMLDRSNYDEGQAVTKAHAIGWVGSTGLSTGPHLHFGVSGSPGFAGWVDPAQYVLDRYWYDDGTHVLAPNERITAGWPVGFRAQADLSPDNIARILPPGTVLECVWWQFGDGAGSGEDRFFLTRHEGLQGYVHFGDVLGGTVEGVPAYEAPVVTPPPAVEPGEPPKPGEPTPLPDPDPEPTPEPEPTDPDPIPEPEEPTMPDPIPPSVPGVPEPTDPTQVEYPGKAVLRTVVQALAVLIPGVNIVAAVLADYLHTSAGVEVPAWEILALNGAVLVTGAIIGGVTRIMAIPGVNAWLEKFGLGAKPRDAA